MRQIKSYFLFTSLLHKIILHIVIPCLALLFALALILVQEDGAAEIVSVIASMAACLALTCYETSMDTRVFGGSMRKGGASMDLLKTSTRGMRLYRDCLAGDQILRALMHLGCEGLVILSTLLLMKRAPLHALGEWLFFSCASYALAQTGISIGRLLKFESNLSVLVAVVCAWATALLIFPLMEFDLLHRPLGLMISAACAFLGLLLGRWMVVRGTRMKGEEYHDC
ncbi:MAG: hypothetical protein IK016_11125 [Lachnospiraceae bacterium]|nr:hypothetical protein [Lachnospiraceae bacterium]